MDARVFCAGAVMVVAVGCAQTRTREDIDFHPAFPKAQAAAVENVGVENVEAKPVETVSNDVRGMPLGSSVQGRAISMTVFGSGVRPVLVIGGIHGSEPTSVDVAKALLSEIQKRPESIGSNSVAIIPVANPDGYLVKSRFNARGVDLNRNFPANNWRKAPARGRKNYGGEALSEPESQAIANAIDTLHPRLIISIHSIDDGRHCNNFDGPAEGIAKLMTTYNKYPAAATIGYPTPGSLGSFAGIDRQIPMITLELPRSVSGVKAWGDNRGAILAEIGAAR